MIQLVDNKKLNGYTKEQAINVAFKIGFEAEKSKTNCTQATFHAISSVLGVINLQIFKSLYSLAGGASSTFGSCGAQVRYLLLVFFSEGLMKNGRMVKEAQNQVSLQQNFITNLHKNLIQLYALRYIKNYLEGLLFSAIKRIWKSLKNLEGTQLNVLAWWDSVQHEQLKYYGPIFQVI